MKFNLALLAGIVLCAGVSYADIPPPPPSSVCSGPVNLRGQAASDLFDSLKVKPVKASVGEGVTSVTKTLDTVDGKDKIQIQCVKLYDSKGKDVGYSFGRRPGCTLIFGAHGKARGGQPNEGTGNEAPSGATN